MKYVVVLLGAGLLAARLLLFARHAPFPSPSQPSFSMNDAPTTPDASQPAADSAAAAASAAEAQAAQAGDTETNPLKRYQDLVNSPATPDGHKVVAAVAAASTVTVAAVANWLIKATKK